MHFNWLVSREGRIAWQKHTGENSLRADIPKESLPGGQNQVPKEGRTYLMTSLPQYEDVKPLLKLVNTDVSGQ